MTTVQSGVSPTGLRRSEKGKWKAGTDNLRSKHLRSTGCPDISLFRAHLGSRRLSQRPGPAIHPPGPFLCAGSAPSSSLPLLCCSIVKCHAEQLSVMFRRASWWDPRKQRGTVETLPVRGLVSQLSSEFPGSLLSPFSPLLRVLRHKHTLKSKLLVCGSLKQLLLKLMSCELMLK